MSRVTNFIQIISGNEVPSPEKFIRNSLDFMVPIAGDPRLCISMHSNDTNWQMWEPRQVAAPPAVHPKEWQLKLSLETRNCGEVIIVHCQGRIVYRDEAAALSRIVGDVLTQTGNLVLDLSGVRSMDSAGIGELAMLQVRARERNVNLKCAGANRIVRTLLDLTRLDTVLDVHPSLESALEAFRDEQVCAEC